MYLSQPRAHQEALQVVPLLPGGSAGAVGGECWDKAAKGQRAVQRALQRGALRSLIWGSPRHPQPFGSRARPSSAPAPAPHLTHHAGAPVPGPDPLGPALTPLASLAAFSSDVAGHGKFVWGCLGSRLTLITLIGSALFSWFEHRGTVPMTVRALPCQPGVTLSSQVPSLSGAAHSCCFPMGSTSLMKACKCAPRKSTIARELMQTYRCINVVYRLFF